MRHLNLLTVILVVSSGAARAADPIELPNGLAITPAAAPHSVLQPLNPGLPDRPKLTLGQAVTTSISPDGTELLVLTSGYNIERTKKKESGNEYIFVYDITANPPRQLQALPVPNSFCGLAWNPDGQEFYVSGGFDDKVYVFARAGAHGASPFSRVASIALGHTFGNGLFSNMPPTPNAGAPKPVVAGLAVNRSRTLLIAANIYNDSISLVDLKLRKKTSELDLRPGALDKSKTGVPGGEYPYWVAIQGDRKAYVSSPRDREVVAVELKPAPTVVGRIKVPGQPNRILLNQAQDRLFIAVDNSDRIVVLDTAQDRVIADFSATAPAGVLASRNAPKGANPNSLALSPDEKTLYVTNGGTNSVAVVAMHPDSSGVVTGLIPTGWYPNSVSVSRDGKFLYVVNAKSVPGPNSGNCRGDARAPQIPDCVRTENQYVLSLEKSTLHSLPVPAPAELAELTKQVARNNHLERLESTNADPVIAELRSKIKHIIYIVKENRTYDQVLGDLEVGDGDPSLTEFPAVITPNHHALARRFVTLDNFFDSGEVSGSGWNWSTSGRTTDYTEKTVPIQYAGRGFFYDWEGANREINVGIATLADRVKANPLMSLDPRYPPDPNLLPGTADVAAPDSADGEAGAGYIWDEAIRADRTVRNYGFFLDQARYESPKINPAYIKISKTPFADGIVQAFATKASLLKRTDPFFRGFDQNNADFYNYKEWEREFDQFVKDDNLPNLSLVRFCHDHFGSFGSALYGLNTPALQIADNDYAIGMLAEKIASSPYRDSTLIFVIEDDAQDGPDHVDAHRSLGYVIGPYVKQGAVVSERYSTVSMVRTMEAILGLTPSSLYGAVAAPMTEVFDLNQSNWDYHAIVPDLLRISQLPLPPATRANSLPVERRHALPRAYARNLLNAGYWQKKLGDMDYDEEDKLDTPRFNRELWKGMMNNQKYPSFRSGKDLRENREQLLRE
jgi:DNA-binding beta-propeller fold protein YncE